MNISLDKICFALGLTLIFAGFALAQSERETGLKLYAEGRNKEAVAALEKASRQAKNDAEVWNALGLAYTKDENVKKAIKSFEKAVEISPQSAVYQTNLAYAYLLNNKFDKTQSAATKAIELDPKNATAYYLRGSASIWEGKPDEAIADAEKAIGYNADYALAYVLKSDALLANFGRRVGGGAKPIDEIDLLRQASDVLEFCLKNCRNNAQTEIQQKRLEPLKIFYNYFSKNRDAVINQTPVGEVSQTPTPPVAPDPNFTPLKILKKSPASYTNFARENGINGTVRIVVLFSETGRVTHTLIVKSLGGGLDENAANAARSIKFEPARKNGKPISQIKILEYSFNTR